MNYLKIKSALASFILWLKQTAFIYHIAQKS